MALTPGQLLRFTGLAIGTVGVVRATWALRGEGHLPLVKLLRRELGPSSRIRAGVAVCAGAGVIMVVMPVAWLLATSAASITVDPRVTDGAAAALVLTIAVKLLLVVFEELAFRAGVIRTFSGHIGVTGALVLGAAAFAAAHGRDVVSSAVLFVDGIGFGVAYVATGSLRAPIAWHAAKNLMVWLLAGPSSIEFAASPLRLAFTDAAPTGSTVAELVSAVIIVAATSAWLLRSARRHGWAGAAVVGSRSADSPSAGPSSG